MTKQDSTKRQCRKCGKPTQTRSCDVVGGMCFSCSTGRPRLLTPETLAVYAQTTRPPLIIERTVFGGQRRMSP